MKIDKNQMVLGGILLIGLVAFYFTNSRKEGFQDITEPTAEQQENTEMAVNSGSRTRIPTQQKRISESQRMNPLGRKTLGSPSYDNANSANLQGSFTIYGAQGPQGPRGPQGIPGMQGPPGPMPQLPDYTNDFNTINRDIIAIKQQLGLINANGSSANQPNTNQPQATGPPEAIRYKFNELQALVASRGLEGVIADAQQQAPYLGNYLNQLNITNNLELLSSYLDGIINFINNDENITPTEVIMFMRGWLTSYGANITEPEPENIERFTNPSNKSYKDFTQAFRMFPIEYAPVL